MPGISAAAVRADVDEPDPVMCTDGDGTDVPRKPEVRCPARIAVFGKTQRTPAGCRGRQARLCNDFPPRTQRQGI